MKQKPKILIINSNIELILALQAWLELQNCETKDLQIYDLKKNINFLKEMLLEFKPDAILYDVSIPYDENWKFFRKISNFEEAKNIKFILTSTNKRNLEKIVGPTNSIEILGKPFDLEELAKAIKIATNRA